MHTSITTTSSFLELPSFQPRTFFAGTLFLVLATILITKITRDAIRSRRFAAAQGCQPPQHTYPTQRLILGFNFIFFHACNIINKSFASGMRDTFNRYGKTYVARVAHKQVINTIDPTNYETFMRTSASDWGIFPGREKLVKSTLGAGIFSASGQEWTHSRQLVRQGMTKMTFDFDAYKRCGDQMVSRIRAQRGAFDYCNVGYEYTFEITAALFFGSIDSKDVSGGEKTQSSNEILLQRFKKDFRRLGEIGRKLTIFVGQIPHLAWLAYGSEYSKAKQHVESFTDNHIASSFASAKSPKPVTPPSDTQAKTLVDALSTSTSDRSRIRRELLNLLLAAHDTNGIALTETIWLLARAPSVWAKLRKEVLQTFHGDLPQSISDLKRLPYLRDVVNEAARLRPTLSVHARKALRDTTLPVGGGEDGSAPLFAPKGSYVVYSNYALHRNPGVFCADLDSTTTSEQELESDVQAFRPERWASINPARYEYLPFGAGARACPGEKMGWSAIAYALVKVVLEFERCEARDEREWTEATAFSFFNRHGCWVAFE